MHKAMRSRLKEESSIKGWTISQMRVLAVLILGATIVGSMPKLPESNGRIAQRTFPNVIFIQSATLTKGGN